MVSHSIWNSKSKKRKIMTYNMFIGRYQSPHKGHMTIFNEYLDKGEPVLIAIRDIEPDQNNPLTAQEVFMQTIFLLKS
jgi:nicotinamide mononucleotide adenylyltransferase